jgi:hypothetical protein
MPKRVKRFLKRKPEAQITQMAAEKTMRCFSAIICVICVLFLLALRRDLDDKQERGQSFRPADLFSANNLPFVFTMKFRLLILAVLAAPPICGLATADPNPTPPRFWSFEKPTRHAPPAVQNASWPKGVIDRFLLARMEQAGLSPIGPADRRTLIRRVYFDITGLPPAPEEMERARNDQSVDWYERLVERLLASPHYGERWARVWLDVARYAEDQAHIVGKDESLFYPNAYLYRDWVIQALNDDMPYDRFIRLQLAADLINPTDTASHVALGFLGLGPKYYGRGSPAVMADEWEDRVDVVGRGLLGLTVACARCHDHKFDPIPTADYYGLAGVFASTRMFNRPLSHGVELKKDKFPEAKSDADTKAMPEAKSPRDAMHIVRDGAPTELNVAIRGDMNNKGPLVARHFLTVLGDGPPRIFHEGSGRRELADAIASPHNPLTARVIVNRIWGQTFGRPLVATPSNFGNLGERPTHPELLDDLAVRFMDAGWSLKWLHREIVLSAAYKQKSEVRRQKSEDNDRRAAIDPENKLLWRMNRRRLTVEMWRDSLLAATGELEERVGGPSMNPQDPTERRRTLYSQVSRLSLNPLLALFDFPDPNLTADRRVETTTPLQKLFMLNSPFMLAQAERLTDRVMKEASGDAERMDLAYQLLYSRPATAPEVRLGIAFLHAGDGSQERWKEYAQVLLAASEGMFVD